MSDSARPHRRQPTRLPRPWDSPGKNTGVGCHFLLQYVKVKSCLTPSNPMDCSLPGSSVCGICQAGVLEWVAIAFSCPASCPSYCKHVSMNIGVRVSLSILVSLVCMPSGGIAGSYGNFISSFLRNFHSVLHSGCTSLHSHQQCKRVPFTQHHLQHLLFVEF